MERDLIEQKRIIINKLVNSGINITPESLEYILNLKNPQKSLSLIIKELSFIPNFKSHLTENILLQISNEKIKKVLKRVIEKKTLEGDLINQPINLKIESETQELDNIIEP